MVRAVLHTVHRHPARGQYGSRAPEDVNLLLLQKALHAGAELLRHLRFLPVEGGEVHGEAFSGDAPFSALLQAHGKLRGVKEALGGDAAPVEAGAAQVTVLRQGGSEPQSGGAQGGLVASGAPADHK